MNPTGGRGGNFNGPTPAGPGQGILAGQAPAKPVSQYKLVGTTGCQRIDIPDIVTGSEVYIQNVRIPGMLHGRVVRPRGQAAWGFIAPIISIDESSIQHIPNVQIVRIGDFLGVVAPHEWDAIQAAAELKVKWADPPAVLPGGGNVFKQMRALDAAGKTVTVPNASNTGQNVPPNIGNVDAALASAAHVVSGEYGFNTLAHTPIGPMCAIASVTAQGARIYVGTQGPYQTRSIVATGHRSAGKPRPRHRLHDGRCLRPRASMTTPPSRPRSCPKPSPHQSVSSSCGGTRSAGTRTTPQR